MPEKDVKLGDLNLTALYNNFEVLKKIVLEQREIIKTQKKDLRLCFSRIDSLNKKVDKKEDSTAGRINDIFGDLLND